MPPPFRPTAADQEGRDVMYEELMRQQREQQLSRTSASGRSIDTSSSFSLSRSRVQSTLPPRAATAGPGQMMRAGNFSSRSQSSPFNSAAPRSLGQEYSGANVESDAGLVFPGGTSQSSSLSSPALFGRSYFGGRPPARPPVNSLPQSYFTSASTGFQKKAPDGSSLWEANQTTLSAGNSATGRYAASDSKKRGVGTPYGRIEVESSNSYENVADDLGPNGYSNADTLVGTKKATKIGPNGQRTTVTVTTKIEREQTSLDYGEALFSRPPAEDEAVQELIARLPEASLQQAQPRRRLRPAPVSSPHSLSSFPSPTPSRSLPPSYHSSCC